jgi:beta-galactosidase/beta-glucuronidase
LDISLNGKWKFAVDEKSIGNDQKWLSPKWIKEHYNNLEDISVPSNFNTLKGLERYCGDVWYFLKLPKIPPPGKNYEIYVEFEGVNYIGEVWINGIHLGRHEGGFLPFRFQFSFDDLRINADNYLAVKVDSRLYRSGIPSDNYDWFNWSGIHRNVQIVILERTRVREIKLVTKIPVDNPNISNIQASYSVKKPFEYLDYCYIEQIEPKVDWVIYYIGRFFGGEMQSNPILIQSGVQYLNEESFTPLEHVSHEQKDLESFFSDLSVDGEPATQIMDLESFFVKSDSDSPESIKPSEPSKVTPKRRWTLKSQKNETRQHHHPDRDYFFTSFALQITNPSLWTPETPEIYEIHLHLNGIDEDKIVQFGIRQIETYKNQILLNHNPIKLKGVSLHEELFPYGRHYPIEERRNDVIAIKTYGFNALRTAHYSHDEALMQVADQEGILILEEIPVYWDCDFNNRKTMKLAATMIRDLIARDFNHPSVIQWSVGNEVPVERLGCARAMNFLLNYARKLDPTRLTSFVSCRFIYDPVRKNSDTVCLNAYWGWYYGSAYQLNFMLDAMYSTAPNKPWIYSEFGAGARYGVHDPQEKFSEENQARILAHHIRVLNSKPYIAGWFIWIYRDFRSLLRTNKFQQGFNRKGIVDEQNRPKLIAKVMRKMIHETLPSIRHYKGLARFFALGMRYAEKLFFGISGISYKVQRKIIYSQIKYSREN